MRTLLVCCVNVTNAESQQSLPDFFRWWLVEGVLLSFVSGSLAVASCPLQSTSVSLAGGHLLWLFCRGSACGSQRCQAHCEGQPPSAP